MLTPVLLSRADDIWSTYWAIVVMFWIVTAIGGYYTGKKEGIKDWWKILIVPLILTIGPLAFVAAICYGVGKKSNDR